MQNDDLARLTAALRTACAELDARNQGTLAPGSDPVQDSAGGPRASRYQEAVREAVVALERSRTSFNSEELSTLRRALEALLLEGPR